MAGWDGIDEFEAVATTGSFARAAAALGVSSSYMSRAIAQLEHRIQAQLFIRTTRTVTLTDRGRVFLDHCHRLIAERDEALALVSKNSDPVGDLRLTCPNIMGERFIVPITLAFCEQYPKVSIGIEVTNRVVDLVAEGFDLGVRTGLLENSRLIGTRIGSRRFVTCAAPAYLERAGRPRNLQELETHHCVIGIASAWHFRISAGDHSFRPKGRWRCNSGDAVVDAALAGLGICHLPEFYVRHHIRAGRLETILQPFCRDDEPIWAVYPQQRHPLPKVRILIDHLRQKLGPAMLAAA
ncbi:DNA-binding transcriptional LysR family regulator [Bradyrhizobium sp. USDA 4341]